MGRVGVLECDRLSALHDFRQRVACALVACGGTVTLRDPLPQGGARIYLGNVDKMDTVFVNGRQVGSSSWVENPRVYFARGLKPGRNVIAIRLFNIKPNGGFLSPAD